MSLWGKLTKWKKTSRKKYTKIERKFKIKKI
jgi:hypothetical protein